LSGRQVRIRFGGKEGLSLFRLEPLTPSISLSHFACSIEEYNEDYCAARFLTVDADIEHDGGVLAFYQKNGFIRNAELFNKDRKTISMRKDIYSWSK
jgi:hypothetical protein